jgi:hypothetical protein
MHTLSAEATTTGDAHYRDLLATHRFLAGDARSRRLQESLIAFNAAVLALPGDERAPVAAANRVMKFVG